MTDPDSFGDTDTIRESIRRLRRAVPEADRNVASARICESFLGLDWFHNAKTVSGFLAFNGEADPLELMTQACQMQKKVYVPMIVGKAKSLLFSPWTPDMRMKPNRFGIAEPDVSRDQWVEPHELDFVITPLVAFDDNCHRIGVGGGFYDRSFAFLNSTDSADPGKGRPTHLVGFAFELQRVEKIDRQTWDVRLDAVVTEWKVY